MTPFDRTSRWLRVAAALMAGAALVHASAAGQHADHRLLAVAFAVTAGVQLTWAAAAALWPCRAAAAGGILLAGGTVAAWALTRIVAFPTVEGLETVQDVGAQDVVCVVLELAAGVAALAALARVRVVRAVVPAAAVAAVALALPASAMVHDHDHAEAAAAAPAAPAGSVGASSTATTVHVHDHGATTATATAATPAGTASAGSTPAGSPPAGSTTATTITNPGSHSSVPDRPPSRDEIARAAALVDATATALAGFHTIADVQAAGYRSIGDAATGYEHFVNAAYLSDGRELDPAHVESVVFRVEADGSKTLVSGMYILEPGRTLADVPDVGGPLTVWHDHQNLCWDGAGRVVGILLDGRCTPRGTFRPTPPMLHVWVVDNPCGPFAGVEATGPLAAVLGSHGDSCAAAHTH
jgi:hypothetical protein